MRQKHSNKKHRILIVATQNIVKQIPHEQILVDQFSKQNDHDLDENLLAKDYEKLDIEGQINATNNEKQNFKQCKIRQLMKSREYSPTHSDIQYIDSMENYKNYLTKSQNIKKQLLQRKLMKHFNKIKEQTQNSRKNSLMNNTHKNYEVISRDKQLTIIQQKISKIKSLGSEHSSEKKFQSTYQEIQKLRFAQKGVKSADAFCLLSVSEYLKLTKSLQSIIGNVRNSEFSKPVYHKAVKRGTSHEAKRWYNSANAKTQRQVDPEGLIKLITFQRCNRNKSLNQIPTNWNQSNLSNLSLNQRQVNLYNESTRQIKNNDKCRIKPSSAPTRRLYEKCKTQQNKTHTNSIRNKTQRRPNSSKNTTSFDMSLNLSFTTKVKGVKHVARQKYDQKSFKNQSSQQINYSQQKQVPSSHVFEYPWNWIKLQNTQKIHAMEWRG